MILQNRLNLIASMVDRGSVVADIGTDHAYLPVYLVQQGICPRALACDVKAAPLERGRQNIIFNRLENKIEVRLSDGIAGISEGEADTFTIAGMGAELIIRILSSCPYIRRGGYTLIIQPMSRYYELIRWLYEEGFVIINQRCAQEGERCYTVIKAVYKGDKKSFTALDTYIGAMNLSLEENRTFLKKEILRMEKRAIGDGSLNELINELKEKIQ